MNPATSDCLGKAEVMGTTSPAGLCVVFAGLLTAGCRWYKPDPKAKIDLLFGCKNRVIE